MSDLTPIIGGSVQLLGYGPGRFQFAGDVIVEGSITLLPDGPKQWAVTDISALSMADVADMIAQNDRMDVLFIGCGASIAPLPKQVRIALQEANVPYELMDTGAACRAFNVLLAEGRRVAALSARRWRHSRWPLANRP